MWRPVLIPGIPWWFWFDAFRPREDERSASACAFTIKAASSDCTDRLRASTVRVERFDAEGAGFMARNEKALRLEGSGLSLPAPPPPSWMGEPYAYCSFVGRLYTYVRS